MNNNEKENNPGQKGKRILKNPSQRHIYTSEGGERAKDFGIIGKGFNDDKKEAQGVIMNNNKKVKDQMSPRDDKKEEKK